MSLREDLRKLKWNSFDRYPPQGYSCYIQCHVEDRKIYKYFKVKKFNAATFDPSSMVRKIGIAGNWIYKWLPEKIVTNVIMKSQVPEKLD